MSASLKPVTPWQRYDAADDAELRRLASSPGGKAMCWDEIALAMGRSVSGVRRRASLLGITPDRVPSRRWSVVAKTEMTQRQLDKLSHYRSRANAPATKIRPCLGRDCEAHFLSEGPHHRMCSYCRENLA